MSDIDRVRQMVDEGRITAEEGEQLIAVLQDVEAAEASLDAAAAGRPSAPADAGPAVAQPEPPQAPAQAPAQTPPPAPPSAEPRATPPETPDAQFQQPHSTPHSTPQATPDSTSHATSHTTPQATPEPASSSSSAGPDPISDAVNNALREAREAARQARHEGREAAREAREAARQAAHQARVAASEAGREASRVARETGRDVSKAVAGLGRLEVGDIGERPGAAIAPPGTPWVTVEMIGGDIDIVVDDTLDGPVAEGGPGNIEIERDEDGFRVKFMPDRGNFIDRFLSSVRSGDLDIRIPPQYGIVIDATAGDVDLHGVRYLRGRLRAGDVSADVLEGVDFSLMAGEFNADLDLRGGTHVVTVGAGEARVGLRDDADVTVTGRVSIGELYSKLPALEKRGQGLGAEAAGAVGEGTARLKLRVTTGDLTIRRAREAASAGANGERDGG